MKLSELLNDHDSLTEINTIARALGFKEVNFLFDITFTGAEEITLRLLVTLEEKAARHHDCLLAAKLADKFKIEVYVQVKEMLSEIAKIEVEGQVFGVDPKEENILRIKKHLKEHLKYADFNKLTLKEYPKDVAEKEKELLDDANQIIENNVKKSFLKRKKKPIARQTLLPAFLNGSAQK